MEKKKKTRNRPSVVKYIASYKIENTKIEYDKGHGRVECREYGLMNVTRGFGAGIQWKNIKSIGYVCRKVYDSKTKKEFLELRYFIANVKDIKDMINKDIHLSY